MYHGKLLLDFETFIRNKFSEIMALIEPIDTKPGREEFKRAELIIAEQINTIREDFTLYEDKTYLLFNSDEPNNPLALSLYQTFLDGIAARLELRKQLFTNTCLALALKVKTVDNGFKALTN